MLLLGFIILLTEVKDTVLTTRSLFLMFIYKTHNTLFNHHKIIYNNILLT